MRATAARKRSKYFEPDELPPEEQFVNSEFVSPKTEIVRGLGLEESSKKSQHAVRLQDSQDYGFSTLVAAKRQRSTVTVSDVDSQDSLQPQRVSSLKHFKS